MQNAKRKMQNEKCKTQNAKRKTQNAKCKDGLFFSVFSQSRTETKTNVNAKVGRRRKRLKSSFVFFFCFCFFICICNSRQQGRFLKQIRLVRVSHKRNKQQTNNKQHNPKGWGSSIICTHPCPLLCQVL